VVRHVGKGRVIATTPENLADYLGSHSPDARKMAIKTEQEGQIL